MKWVFASSGKTTNRCQIVDLTTLVRRWLLNVKKLWPGEESGASIGAAHITWPPFLLLAEWSVLAGNKNCYLLLFSKYSSLPVRLKHIFKHVLAEVVGRRFCCFDYAGLWGMSFVFSLLFPGEKCRDGIVLSWEAFLYLIKLCSASWLASCLPVDDKPGETAPK